MSLIVGILTLQGDFSTHRRRLEEVGASVVLVKTADQLRDIGALVIPGGESTTLIRLLGETGLRALARVARTKPTFGTCAGAILLATDVELLDQPVLGVIDMTIRRNAYGRQLNSSIRTGTVFDVPTEMVFIRAPRIVRVGPRVEIIATVDGEPVGVRQGRAMATTFHPELGADRRVHQMFLDIVAGGPNCRHQWCSALLRTPGIVVGLSGKDGPLKEKTVRLVNLVRRRSPTSPIVFATAMWRRFPTSGNGSSVVSMRSLRCGHVD